MSGWQPIETVPRDGNRVLVWVEGRSYAVGRWLLGAGLYYGQDRESQAGPATHWMPLPEPPQ